MFAFLPGLGVPELICLAIVGLGVVGLVVLLSRSGRGRRRED